MRISARTLLPALIAASVLASPDLLEAQTCLGNAAFAKNHLQMTGDYTVSDAVDEIGASFVSGSNSVFAGLGVGSTSFDGGDATINIRGTLGYSVPATASGSVQVCPLLRASFGLPTENYNGLGGDLTTQTYGLGLSIGGELMRAERLSLVPAVSFGVQREVFKITGGIAPEDISETYSLAGFALGIVLNDALSLRPSVTMPINARFDEPIYGVTLSLNYGGRR